MDPYQQAMIQALMGQQTGAPGTMGQNPSTPYGAGYMTGNQMMPAWMTQTQQAPPQGVPNQTQLMQPNATYAGMGLPAY